MHIQTDRTVIEVLGSDGTELMLNYYIENREHLAPWEPTRSEEYFTLSNFSEMLHDNKKSFQDKTALKFSALNPERNEVIAVCNFTNIVFAHFKPVISATPLLKSIKEKG